MGACLRKYAVVEAISGSDSGAVPLYRSEHGFVLVPIPELQ